MVGRMLVLVLTVLSAAAVDARPAGQAPRIGVLLYDGAPPGFLEAFRDELRALGHVEGRNLTTELRNAHYVDRILKGDLGTGRALGLKVPPSVLLIASQVIE